MSPDIYDAFKLKWSHISSNEHRQLIYQYVEGKSSSYEGSWMEFLQKLFCLAENSSCDDRKMDNPVRRSCKNA